MPKQKLLLKINLDGKPKIGDSLLFISRNSAFNSNVLQSDLYKTALSKYMIGQDIKIKINHIIDLVNKKGHNIEVIQKSSKGQNFNNFIKSDQKSKNKANISNVAFIIRVGEIEESLIPVNTVILTVSFEREFKTVNGILHPHFTEVLSSIQLTKLPKNRYGHRAAVSLDEVEIITKFDNNETQLKQRDFSSLAGLQKAFDMYGSTKSKIQLKEQSHFIQKFNDFLKAKEDNKLIPYFISDEGMLKLKEEKEYSFYTIKRGTQIIEPKDRFYIGSNKDYSSKIGVVVRKVEVLEYSDLIDEEIAEEENFKDRANETIESDEVSISNEIKIISNLEDDQLKAKISIEKAANDLRKINENIELVSTEVSKMKSQQSNFVQSAIFSLNKLTTAKEDLKNIEFKMSKNLKDIEKVESQIIKVSRKNQKSKDNKKSKKNDVTKKEIEEKNAKFNDSIDLLKDKFDDYSKQKILMIENIEELSKNNDSINIDVELCKNLVEKIESKLKNLNQEKEEFAEVLYKKKENLEKIKRNLENSSSKREMFESNIIKQKKEIELSNKRIETFENNLDKFNDEEMIWIKLKVSVTSSKREKSLQSSLNIETSTFKDIALRHPKDCYFSDYDAGLNMKFKRFLYTIRAYESGSYKSPYAALSLEKPDVLIEINSDVNSPSISLNEHQQQALNATANSHFASFLQGPPGTGKTQVIASAVENEIANGRNVLISSSTNAAINNAMERMNRLRTNPNVFFLRHSNNIDKIKEAQAFTSQMLYPNFIERLDGFVSHNSLAEEIDLSPIEAVEQEVFTRKYVPEFYFKKFISQIKTFHEIKYFVERFEAVEDEDVAKAKSEIKEILIHNRRSSMKAKAEKLDNYVATKINQVSFEKDDTFATYLEKLRNYSNSDLTGGEFNRRLKNLSKKFDPEKVAETKSKEFASFLFDNSYINVIGITTTSQLAIKQTGGKKQRELFVDYPVNFAIIDEISKSVTPEILSVAKLADRFMFAGDYRQLPPTSEISPKLIEEFRQYCIKNMRDSIMVDQTISTFGINDGDKFSKSINDLLAISLFTNQVNDMKRSKKENTSYTALKTQYRFNSIINELVNLTYDTNEALNPGKSDSQFNKYEMGLRNLSESSVTIVDTSFISSDYAKKLNLAKATKLPVETGQEAFDHNEEIFYKRAPYNSKINEYNSHVITRIIENLKERNKKSFDASNIGIIAMTRSQAQVIKKELQKYDGTKSFYQNIKVDTVDNFQGQEKDIIILDLVRARGQLSGRKIIYGNRNLDFYKKPERINVAVSRAQSKLIVVGAINNYLAQEVISDVFINGSLKSINLFEEWKDIIDEKGENTTWEKY